MTSKKLTSDFTFGFEFEGFAKLDNFMSDIEEYDYDVDDWNDLSCNSLYDSDYDDFYNNVNCFINDKLYTSSGRTHYDGSVKNFARGYQSFEYSSPVMKYTPKNIKKIKDFFKNMESYGFGVNSTCGFHTHISFPKISELDAIWMLCQIANNDQYINEFCYMKTKNDVINFHSERYANKDFLYEIQHALKSFDIDGLINIINSEKYRVIRIHPQGTLEWRGPRNFLDLDGGIDLFIVKLAKIMNILSTVMNATELNGVSKRDFFQRIYNFKKDCYLNGYRYPYSSKVIKRNGKIGLAESFGKKIAYYDVREISKKITKSVIKHPEKLVNMDSEVFFTDVIHNLKKENALSNVLENLKQKGISLPENTLITMVNSNPSLLYMLTPEAFKKAKINDVFSWIENINIMNHQDENVTKTLNFILTNVNDDILLDCTLSFINNALWTISPIVELIKKGHFKNKNLAKLFSRYKRSYNMIKRYNINSLSYLKYSPEELHKLFESFIQDNLITDIKNEPEFNENMSDNEPFIQTFFMLDSHGFGTTEEVTMDSRLLEPVIHLSTRPSLINDENTLPY